MGRVAQIVLDLVLGRLADPELGFNPTLAALAPDYSTPDSAVSPFAIDFTPESQNFWIANVQFEDLLDSNDVKYDPAVMLLYAGTQRNMATDNAQKYLLFSGDVECAIDVYYSWPGARAPHDAERPLNLIGETLVTVFNRYMNQDWGTTVAYNGGVDVTPGALVKGGEHWYQAVLARLHFGVHTT